MSAICVLNTEAANDVRVRALLADSLVLWRVAGTVEACAAPAVALIRAGDGTLVWVERPADGALRWLVRSRGTAAAAGARGNERERPCASLVGMLNAVRNALGVQCGAALRIAPAPADP